MINRKGFTLIELLVVIAIVAILAVVVILTLNPAELLKQARDSTRVSDLSTLKSAISYYLADQANPTMANPVTACYMSHGLATSTGCGSRFSGYTAVYSSSSAKIDGTGWMGYGTGTGMNLTSVTTGAPIGQLPLDPSGANATYFYSYVASSTNNYFEINADLESTKYSVTAATNLENRDGGNVTTVYEVGSYSLF